MPITLQEEDGLFIITMNNGENRWNRNLLNDLTKCLDQVEQVKKPKCLIFVGTGKYFSNGLDLEWFSTIKDRNEISLFLEDIWKFLARLMIFPCPTISAINGHAFGAGIFLALSCDFRYMNSEKGWICFPESSLGMPLSGFSHILNEKVSNQFVKSNGILLSKRFTGIESKKYDLVDEIFQEKDLLEESKKNAKKMLVISKNVKVLKNELWSTTGKKLREAKSGTPPSSL